MNVFLVAAAAVKALLARVEELVIVPCLPKSQLPTPTWRPGNCDLISSAGCGQIEDPFVGRIALLEGQLADLRKKEAELAGRVRWHAAEQARRHGAFNAAVAAGNAARPHRSETERWAWRRLVADAQAALAALAAPPTEELKEVRRLLAAKMEELAAAKVALDKRATLNCLSEAAWARAVGRRAYNARILTLAILTLTEEDEEGEEGEDGERMPKKQGIRRPHGWGRDNSRNKAKGQHSAGSHQQGRDRKSRVLIRAMKGDCG